MAKKYIHKPVWVPEPEDIEERKAQVQATWTAEERARRDMLTERREWSPPAIASGSTRSGGIVLIREDDE